jgi:hypothetical protein
MNIHSALRVAPMRGADRNLYDSSAAFALSLPLHRAPHAGFECRWTIVASSRARRSKPDLTARRSDPASRRVTGLDRNNDKGPRWSVACRLFAGAWIKPVDAQSLIQAKENPPGVTKRVPLKTRGSITEMSLQALGGRNR